MSAIYFKEIMKVIKNNMGYDISKIIWSRLFYEVKKGSSMPILKCPKCWKYTLQDLCHTKTVSGHPLRFAASDKYGKYRRTIKRA